MQIKYNDKLRKELKTLVDGLYIYNHPVKKQSLKTPQSTVEPETPQNSMPVQLHDLMTPSEVEEYLSISWMTLKRWTRAEKIHAIRINERGDRRYLREDIVKFLEEKHE